MKKLFATALLLCSFVMFSFADGGVPINGRQCPPAPEPCPTGLVAEDPKTVPLEVKIGIGFRFVIREVLRGFRI